MTITVYIASARTFEGAGAIRRLQQHLAEDSPLAYSHYPAVAAAAQERMPYFERGAPWSEYRMKALKLELGPSVSIGTTESLSRSVHMAAKTAGELGDLIWLPDAGWNGPGNRYRFVTTREIDVRILKTIDVLPVPHPV